MLSADSCQQMHTINKNLSKVFNARDSVSALLIGRNLVHIISLVIVAQDLLERCTVI